jgi:sugar phosphate isomerase/epimerase
MDIVNNGSRRQFLKTSLGIAAGITFAESMAHGQGVKKGLVLPLGVCAGYEKSELMKGIGFDYIEESVGRFLIPDSGEAGFQKNLEKYQAQKFPIRSYTSFFPGTLKSVGEDTHHEAILERADLAMKRAVACGSLNIVFGSGGSRAIPEGFDRNRAKQQHIELSKKLAVLAGKHGINVSIEPLNTTETNFINSLAAGVEIIEAVNHPRFRLTCDIYHMLKDGESADQIEKYGKHIAHCHIAEREKRTSPGIAGDDFRPYLKALKKIKYNGGLSLECRWGDFDKEIKLGYDTLKKQMSEV